MVRAFDRHIRRTNGSYNTIKKIDFNKYVTIIGKLNFRNVDLGRLYDSKIIRTEFHGKLLQVKSPCQSFTYDFFYETCIYNNQNLLFTNFIDFVRYHNLNLKIARYLEKLQEKEGSFKNLNINKIIKT